MTLKSALFVDFDNIYLGLRDMDPGAAEAFAARPDRWMNWLEGRSATGEAAQGVPDRRFLVRNVYLNPEAFGKYRAFFTRSGFRSIDCPPLTTRGKNSADISMVLDIMDALADETRYDEFVIMSADADFTPVLQRLRAKDRWTTVVAASVSAAAFRATCDVFVTPEQLAAASRWDEFHPPGEPLGGDAERAVVVLPQQAGSDRREAVVREVHRVVRAAPRPLAAATAAHAALSIDPSIKDSAWYGAGSFSGFVKTHCSDLEYVPTSPGYILDPTLHSFEDQGGRAQLPRLLAQVCALTDVPALQPDAYALLFEVLAQDLRNSAFQLYPTSKRVRDETEARGNPVTRNAVNFVLKGLVYVGQSLAEGVTADALADAWVDNVYTLCANARMSLSDEDRGLIRRWITGGDISGSDEPA
ncbi:NYN domain-containing protein [Streptomyces antimicrobicus]|uniref:NYN domain-containing protein n=1 Tax=Streptomyces antimicrobicus TaxID=2883108 RepID=A0ABS8BAB3_9ACTN|nr:NYN domain-containing protein [Streptomyces antimicrobicus]MCB5181544.1 NYN domain-containing protein [Streptomyces antimicrobicus]